MFKGSKKIEKATLSSIQNTFISPHIEVEGDFSGEGAVQVEGIVHGNLTVTSVVIGEYGEVNGIIHAKNVIINGKLNGSVFCNNLEIMQNGKVSNELKVKTLLISGDVNANIQSTESIIIESTGSVNTTIGMQSKHIVVNGIFKGNITASELLEVGSTGSVEGKITVKNIKTHEGGKLLGSMQIYEEETLTSKPS